jgi:hypothetical protein
MTLSRSALASAATLACLAATTAHATEGGGTVVPIGVQTIVSGVMQDPGDYLLTYNTWVHAGHLPDANGADTVPDFRLRVQAHSLRYLHVFDSFRILGGTPAFEIASARVNSAVSSAYFSGHDTGLGDTSLGPSLGWHSPDLHQQIAALVVVPTGSYDKTKTDNVGRNYYALQLDYALTYFFGFGEEVSAMNKVVINRSNPATHYRSGTELDIDYALNQHLPHDFFVGVGGYLHRQFSDDTQDGQVYAGGYRVKDFAIGPQVGWGTPRYGGYLAWQHQATARNTAQGDLLWLNMFVKF